MATATCPECDAEVNVDEVDADIGGEVSGPECDQNLVVSGRHEAHGACRPVP